MSLVDDEFAEADVRSGSRPSVLGAKGIVPRVESAVQEAGLRALERWQSPESCSAPEGWLVRVAHNTVVDEHSIQPLDG